MYTRRHDVDALRVIAFAILIAYHVAMYYVAGWHWHLKNPEGYPWLQWLMVLVNPWRMALLFTLSGMAAAFTLRKLSTRDFVRQRSLRLLPGFVFGVVLVVPIQPYLQAIANGSIDISLVEFYLRYFSFQAWPVDAFDGWQYRFTWNHLWFIPYLITYLLLIALVHKFMRAQLLTFIGWVDAKPWLWALLPVLWLYGVRQTLLAYFDHTHAWFNDWTYHLIYFSYFLLGYALVDMPRLWCVLKRHAIKLLALALCSYGTLIGVFWVWNTAHWHHMLRDFVIPLNQWLWILAVLACGHRVFNRELPWVTWANKRVYTWYIWHQSLIVMAAFYLEPLIQWDWLECSAIIVFTLMGCWLASEITLKCNWQQWLTRWQGGRQQALKTLS